MTDGQVTIVIPTHRRAAYLARALEFASTQPFRYLVCDSSPRRLAKRKIPSNVEYLHLPQLNFNQKLSVALEKVSTPYVTMCGDDDFLIADGVKHCVEHLKAHPDYACVSGRTVSFRYVDGKIVLRPAYQYANQMLVNDSKSEDRILRSFENYYPLFYSVHRTPILSDAIRISNDFTNPCLTELMVCFVAATRGKHRTLPVFFHAREMIPGSSGSAYPNLIEMGDAPEKHPEFTAAIQQMTKYLAQHSGRTKEQARKTIEQLFAVYRDFYDRQFNPIQQVKEGFRKVVELNSKVSWLTYNLYAQLLALRTGVDPGYPYLNRKNRTAWRQIAELIRRHRIVC